jgi:hypothetical protein
MPTAVEDGVKKVEKRYTDVHQKLKGLAAESDTNSEFWKIIHTGGWTTIIDVNYAAGILEAVTLHAQAIESLKRTLVEGARGAMQQKGSSA